MKTTTQQQHPWRATARTVVQVALTLTAAAIAVGPLLADFIDQQWPGSPAAAWIIGAVAFLSALSGLLARIAALPAIDRVLELVGLGSAPEVAPHDDTLRA